MAGWRVPSSVWDLWAYRLGRGSLSAFAEVRDRVRGRVERGASEVWDDAWWFAAMDRSLVPVLRQTFDEVSAETGSALGLGDELSPGARVEVDRRLELVLGPLRGVAETAGERVRRVVAEEDGATVGVLLDRLGLFRGASFAGPLSTGVARTVAVTSTGQAVNGASSAVFDVEGDGLKVWRCQIVNSRNSHIEANGQTVGPDGLFEVGGFPALFPGDPDLPPAESINCLCSLELGV